MDVEPNPGIAPDPSTEPDPDGHAGPVAVFKLTAEHWRARVEWPITIAALAFLVVYAWDVIADLQGSAAETAEWIMWSIWLIFVVDYAMNVFLAERRWHWFFTHLPQFFVVALPMLRPLRLLRLVTLWTLLHKAAGTWVRGRLMVYVIGSATLLVLIASLAELEAERNAPGAEITTFPDSLWWVFETITTVGYGDNVPVTFEGRVIAVGLMIAGIALLGVITATFASWMVESVQAGDSRRNRVTLHHVDALSDQVRELQHQLEAFRSEYRDGRNAPAGEGGVEAGSQDPG